MRIRAPATVPSAPLYLRSSSSRHYFLTILKPPPPPLASPPSSSSVTRSDTLGNAAAAAAPQPHHLFQCLIDAKSTMSAANPPPPSSSPPALSDLHLLPQQPPLYDADLLCRNFVSHPLPELPICPAPASSDDPSMKKMTSSPSWRRRSLTMTAPPPAPVVSHPLDPFVTGMLNPILGLCRDIGGSRMKRPRVCQKQNAAVMCRRAAALVPLFEEVRDSGAWIPPSALRSFESLRELLGRAKALIHHCRHSSSLVLLLLEHETVTDQFRQLSLNLAEILAPLPFDLLQISPDVRDQVRLVQRHSTIAATFEDRHETMLRREIASTMAALEDGCSAPEAAQLRRIFDGLGFSAAADCERELKRMEAEKEKLKQQQNFDKIPEVNNLMSFVRYARCILYGLAVGTDAAAAAACRRIDLSLSRSTKTVVLANAAAGAASDVPEDFLCPISLEIMVDPVVSSSGHSYERAAIERWLADGHGTCPKTGATLLHRNVIPNTALRRLIAQWCAENGFILDDAAFNERHRVDALPASRAAMEATRLTAAFLVEKLSGGASRAVQRQVAQELRLMAKEGMDNRESMASAGAIPALVDLLRRDEDGIDDETQEHAVTALLNLSISDKNKDVIMGTPGAVCAIVGVLARGASVEARENAAAALFSLTAARNYRVTVGAEDGAIDGLLVVMRRGSCERARRDAAATLFNVALHGEHAAELRRKGALRAAMEAVKAGEEDAVSLLAVLVRRGGEEEVAELSAGIEEIAGRLVEVVGGGSGNTRAQEHALSLLVAACSAGEGAMAAWRRRMAWDTALVAALRKLRYSGTNRAQRKSAALLKLLQQQQYHHTTATTTTRPLPTAAAPAAATPPPPSGATTTTTTIVAAANHHQNLLHYAHSAAITANPALNLINTTTTTGAASNMNAPLLRRLEATRRDFSPSPSFFVDSFRF